ncbi:DNA polymerase III subunit gamma/tau [Actinomarinicola tropica]|uniref:DNA polymerase III subunit gamma/tau n=1 Tax=Actinomarinicola tropica TaxID=2789776 RepID=A0A5Q2RPV1_9ACTN|nr:DNA polymerase III subunit gamma/tau [Actinomarinicola tropica]QGG96601.1 DNA polymerase III subunit gamma/tau [Actinomarinicola tropica]
MAYQSLYRRYRSGRFDELRGQEHVVRALRNAVREDRVGHAYLFSGPRGTGKTSTARILAKALNCEDLTDGEPCGVCESCRSIEAGTSFDLHELDAASNNGVEAVRDLIGRAGIGSPGRTKVYILDEVHMLSAGASNALLKTLEEPPPHVVFVLATTDPHKVLPTIRSRTQHLEFGLLPADVLEEHVRWVVADAGLDVTEEGIAYALRQGGGSARDTLSALDQVVAAGGAPAGGDSVDALVESLCERDTAAAMVALAEALSVGREPRPIAEDLLARLRDIFLASVQGPLQHLTDADQARAAEQASRLGRATITRALELVGEAIADMRHVGDTRIPLEVALVRMTRPEVDTSMAALVERVARLERGFAEGGPAPSPPAVPTAAASTSDRPASTAPATAPPAPPAAPPAPAARRGRPGDAARAALAGSGARPPAAAPEDAAAPPTPEPRAEPEPTSAPPPEPETTAAPAEPEPAPAPSPGAPAASSGAPTLAELEAAWPAVLGRLSNRARARYNAGHFVAADGAAEFALPNAIHRDRCEELRPDVEAALAEQLGRPVAMRLVVGGEADPSQGPLRRSGGSAASAGEGRASGDEHHDEMAEIGDVSELDNADVASSSIDRITELFPGAEVVEE